MRNFVLLHQVDVGEVLIGLPQIAVVRRIRERGSEMVHICLGTGQTLAVVESWDTIMGLISIALEPAAAPRARKAS